MGALGLCTTSAQRLSEDFLQQEVRKGGGGGGDSAAACGLCQSHCKKCRGHLLHVPLWGCGWLCRSCCQRGCFFEAACCWLAPLLSPGEIGTLDEGVAGLCMNTRRYKRQLTAACSVHAL